MFSYLPLALLLIPFHFLWVIHICKCFVRTVKSFRAAWSETRMLGLAPIVAQPRCGRLPGRWGALLVWRVER